MNGDAMKSIALMALAVVAIGGGLVYWQYSARGKAEAKVKFLESQIPDEQQLQADLTASQTELAKYRTDLEHLEKSIPSSAYVPTLLKELEVVGNQNKLAVTGVRPVQAVAVGPGMQDDKPYEELEIDITGQGTYGAVMDLVASLQRFPKILAVRTIGLAPKQDPLKKTSDLDATVRLRAFVFKDVMKEDANGKALNGSEVSSL